MTSPKVDLTHRPLSDRLKEVFHRVELRPRLEAELGKPLSGEGFLAIAEKSGLKI